MHYCLISTAIFGLLYSSSFLPTTTQAFAFSSTRLNYVTGVDPMVAETDRVLPRHTRDRFEEDTQDVRGYFQGRIEDSFDYAKFNGEAAFVSYVTAGYPSQKGTIRKRESISKCAEQRINFSHSRSSTCSQPHLPFCWPCKKEGPL